MTKEQRTDALLEAGKCWQNHASAGGETAFELLYDGCPLWEETNHGDWFALCASAALSEVAGMGYELVNADGTGCEKVAVVESVKVNMSSDSEADYFYKLRPVTP